MKRVFSSPWISFIPIADGATPDETLPWFLKSEKNKQIQLAFLVSCGTLDYQINLRLCWNLNWEHIHLFTTSPSMAVEEKCALFLSPLWKVTNSTGWWSCQSQALCQQHWCYLAVECQLSIASASCEAGYKLELNLLPKRHLQFGKV